MTAEPSAQEKARNPGLTDNRIVVRRYVVASSVGGHHSRILKAREAPRKLIASNDKLVIVDSVGKASVEQLEQGNTLLTRELR